MIVKLLAGPSRPAAAADPAPAHSTTRRRHWASFRVSLVGHRLPWVWRFGKRLRLEPVHDLLQTVQTPRMREKNYPSDVSRERFEQIRPILEQA
ncbi:hypothetical protein, partial [Xanthomonas oryzae]|uniref:hypothetical protein n=1 Tax=Xanthomonas oryzae TaxID=347 RepID=UPI00211AFC5D